MRISILRLIFVAAPQNFILIDKTTGAFLMCSGTNLTGRLIARGTKERNAKLGQRGLWTCELVTWPTFEILGPLRISKTICSGKMWWALLNVALSATLYIAFKLRDPARLCLWESLNSGDAHQYTTLNLRSNTNEFFTDSQNKWCFFKVLWYENKLKISNKTANINVKKTCSL